MDINWAITLHVRITAVTRSVALASFILCSLRLRESLPSILKAPPPFPSFHSLGVMGTSSPLTGACASSIGSQQGGVPANVQKIRPGLVTHTSSSGYPKTDLKVR